MLVTRLHEARLNLMALEMHQAIWLVFLLVLSFSGPGWICPLLYHHQLDYSGHQPQHLLSASPPLAITSPALGFGSNAQVRESDCSLVSLSLKLVV